MTEFKNIIVILPVLAGALWGTTGIFVRSLDEYHFDNITMVSLRFSIAAVLLFLWLVFYDRSLFRFDIRDIWIFAATGLTGILLTNIFYNLAVIKCSLSLAAVLVSALAAVFIVPISAVLFKEKITAKKLICMFAVIAGSVLVSGVLEETNVLWSAAGIMFGILSGLTYAAYGIFSRIGTDRNYNALTITFYGTLLVALVLIPFTDWGLTADYIVDEPLYHSVNLLLQGLLPSALPYAVYAISVKHMDPGRVTIIATGAEPITAMICGIFMFAEIPSIIMAAGMAVTIAALTALSRVSE